ncbi:class I SAM-dependent methyltransferase [Kitasatospora sp. NPDC006697]|uniref:class I SAM-dependent methyltransferase n=1 Tax=Kitasatospora sp. NPDC006697 TaxID=3364020 RepID=UPI0036941DD7
MSTSRAPAPSSASTWAAGDYPAMARRLVPVAERVVRAARIAPGTTVLDVGTGTGNAALAAARRGALVTAADPTPELLTPARQRARAEELTISWQQADAASLTGAFDRVLTVFGAMYAPDHAAAASALLRCCRPGGRIVSAAWTPDGFTSAVNRAMAGYLPPPPAGGQPPARWGSPEYMGALFAGAEVTTSLEVVRLDFPSAAEGAAFWIRTAGHLQAERARLTAAGRWEELHQELAAVFTEWNRAGGGAGVAVDAAYLLVTADQPLT